MYAVNNNKKPEKVFLFGHTISNSQPISTEQFLGGGGIDQVSGAMFTELQSLQRGGGGDRSSVDQSKDREN